jgi:hypothetical protein
MRGDLEEKIEAARKIVKIIQDDEPTFDLRKACMHHAWAFSKITGAQIVAGSASWKFTNLDDGMNPTHFSYEFEQYCKEQGGHLLIDKHLPEMHVWNLYQGKTLDICSGYFPFMAEQAGFIWDAEKPPAYHFGKPIHKKGRFSYRPNPAATKLAHVILNEIEDDLLRITQLKITAKEGNNASNNNNENNEARQ